jgi:hypothetical protein
VQRGAVLALADVPLMFFGLLLVILGGRTLLLEVCSPSAAACEASLAVQRVLDTLYSPDGLRLLIGLAISRVGIVLLGRNRARRAR